ncbi:MSMEG_0568 family radical SAM protein [Solimonas sp. C16B3]|uniref:MSMEG_0568 family radical SAM protein n=1 Tax=Solimonas marina TaxID=2714601 RepID=A0A969WCU3_9GAMM|nr:MSMEG_0568 family radical SAM protein [Solimonas marina]
MTELQASGLRLEDPNAGAAARRGGAGPTDHKAVTVGGRTVMVPVHSDRATHSPYIARAPDARGHSVLERNGLTVARIEFPRQPRFYGLQTLDGVPYSKIAQLHGRDVLATTVLQTCIRYGRRSTSCQFCAIGESLKGGRTINRKTPEQLGEVARAALLLDGVKHMVMTTGTPNFTDRGAQLLCESAFGVKAAVAHHGGLPIQGQCEPPDDARWFARMKDAGIDALGMHLEAVTPEVRARIMPGKASVGIDEYLRAFADAVAVFGRGQVSTYILAGLGDSDEAILAMCETLIGLGVYPFVVPFVPVGGTPLADHPTPDAARMRGLLAPLGRMLVDGGLRSADIKAGCGKCGACSSLSAYENDARELAA